MSSGSIRVTAFDWVPDFAKGQVRDLRVRWALEEAGLAYDEIVIEQGAQTGPGNLARQPFGQVPAIEIDGQSMFESGAIAWRIATMAPALLPADRAARDRALSWVFASLDSVEPPIAALADLDFFVEDEDIRAGLRPRAIAAVETRLGQLAAALGQSECLVGEFSVADLMMTSVLRGLRHTDILERYPTLARYVQRHSARPAFGKALAAQLQTFARNAHRYEAAA